MLPSLHAAFQGKHYLWGLFKRREGNVNVEEENMRGTPLSGHEKENGREQCSRPRVDKSGIDMERGALSARSNASTPPAERVVAEAATPAPGAATATAHSPSRQAVHAAAVVTAPAPAATARATSSTRPAEHTATEATAPAPTATEATAAPAATEATAAPAATEATTPAPAATEATAAPAATDCVYGFIIARPTPKTQQLIQLIGEEGGVVYAMRGETIGFGLGSR
jgi:hypothetical protein